jgi:putative cell wall-binding protein
MVKRPTSIALTIGIGALIVAGGSIVPASAVPNGVQRIGGTDRFEVSAAISTDTFPGPAAVPIAYIVSGESFPDALSASALAGLQGGPVLLTRKAALPDSIRTELSRIDPIKIVVLGGVNAVSDAVVADLKRFSPTVTRIGGADRFEVSAAASRAVFAPGTPVPTVSRLYIASGENYPDALSGSAAAAFKGGPVLLVTKSGIPATVKTELLRIRPSEIVVLGGTNAVDETVIDELKQDVQSMTSRISGSDRFAVSAKTSAVFPAGTTKTVFVASGENYPDALSGGVAAARNLGPLLLVRSGSLPDEIKAELRRLQPTKIVILGGASAVGVSVESELRGFPVP